MVLIPLFDIITSHMCYCVKMSNDLPEYAMNYAVGYATMDFPVSGRRSQPNLNIGGN